MRHAWKRLATMMLCGRRGAVVLVTALAALGGALVAFHYHQLGLTLSHYDARGHLVVARRIFDSLTPGWQQIGAVWLPLPHALNATPAQVDFFYRTGLSAVAISVASFAVATGAIAWIVATITRSSWAALAGALVFALNPNILYLQATPMTEPLLLALTVLAVALLVNACADHSADARGASFPAARVTLVGSVLSLACMTRYEAWPVMVAALAAATWAVWRVGVPLRTAVRRTLAIAVYPALAILAFLVFSRIVVGAWFPGDFFVPENPSQGRPAGALADVAWGIDALSGRGLLAAGAIGAVALVGVAATVRRSATAVIPLALLASAAVPWVAFVDGHPYRIRYMAPLIAAQAVYAGAAAGLWKRGRLVTVPMLVALVAFELRPLDVSAPLVAEAQWDRANTDARDQVSRNLAAAYGGETVMASMGSLGHYMHDLSRYGFRLRDFLHEGNGDIWLNALDDPRPYAGWLLVEEKAEGGDMLARRARENPGFLDGFSRVCEGAGVALYRRLPAPQHEDARR